MQDYLNLTVKDTFLTDLQLEKLERLVEPFGVKVAYSKCKEGYNVNLSWDTSAVNRKSSRYAGRNKVATDIDWTQVDYLKSMGMTNDEISDHLGVNIRTYYRRQAENKKNKNDSN